MTVLELDREIDQSTPDEFPSRVPFAARYDCRDRCVSFDFFTWLMHVRALGANEIVFGTDLPAKSAWSSEEIGRRFTSIVEPGPALIGLPSRIGVDGEDFPASFGVVRLHKLVKALGADFQRLKTVLPPYSARYTVTMRKATLKPHRNSDEQVWRKFAKKIGAVVIEDYAVKPIHLHERMALYAGAEMNFGVTNGPTAMLFYTSYPVMMFDCNNDIRAMAKHGIPEGGRHPLALPYQKLIWEKPTMDNLMREFKAL